jgi:hypothetical protein
MRYGEPMNVTGRCHCGTISYEAVVGSPVYSTSATEQPKTYSLRVGCLEQRRELRPARQIWCRSALPWAMNLEDVAQVPKG